AVPKARRSSSASLIPAMVAGLGSNGLGPRRPDEPRGTNLFGSFPIVTAPWALDDKGRVNGSFVEISKDSCTTVTNSLPICVDTNISFSVTNQFGVISDNNITTNFHLCFTNGTLQTNLTWSATSSEDGTTNVFHTNLTLVNTNF